MLFNSYIFVLLFLPLTVMIYHLINKHGHYTAAKLFLLGMSLWFYCYTKPENVLVLLLSIVFNYLVSLLFKKLEKNSVKKLTLFLSVTVNLALLIYFKYTGFLVTVVNDLSGSSFSVENLLLPMGISFFTFSQISFLVDSYRDPDSSYSLLDYALFISFFPKIAQGPIAFAKEMIPQFNDSLRKTLNYENMAKGIMIFSFGLAKKVLIADQMAKMADWGYTNLNLVDSSLALITILAYTMQIYFDFSGYCDMASGICLMINIELPVNFDSPYRALSINEFWKRWHITLTRFFRNYVYFPLGGSRKGAFRTYLNIFIIYLLSGIWHGANYTFILWGVIYGIGMCISKAISPVTQKLPRVLRFIMTFSFVNFAWIFFRAATVENALHLIKTLFSFTFKPIPADFIVKSLPVETELLQWILNEQFPGSTNISGMIFILIWLIFAIVASIAFKNPIERAKNFKPKGSSVIVTVILLVWSVLSLSEVSTFIYTNF
ncbi:MAG: MBOAT family protein [Lachnospiraceae bacterium]|nr:MBOAT family protein [Lachnospiraceae bacterium]